MCDQYWERMEYLRNRIQDQQILKEAQVQNSAAHRNFQMEIIHLTDELRLWEQNLSRLTELEADIAAANARVRAARDALRTARNWLGLAVVCGLIEALFLVLSLRWSLNPLLPEAGAVLLVLGAGAVFIWMRVRASAEEERASANLELTRLRPQRYALIPPSHPFIDPFPRFSYEVIIRDK